MRELRYGSEMQDYTCDNKCYIKWEFPEIIHINKDTLYEIEYKKIRKSDSSNIYCTYKVSYIKPVSAFIERMEFIFNMFNKINKASDFEKWFREHYKLQVIIR